MRNFQQKNKHGNLLHSKPVLIFLGILILFFAWGVFSLMNKMQITIENKRKAENKFIELQNKKEKFSAEIAKLKTESGIEESIREKFGLVKEGEDMIVIIEDKNTSAAREIPTNGFFLFFKNLLK